MKISRKETNVKECLGILIMSLAATVDSDNWESIFLVAFMIISGSILIYLSKKR